MTRYIFVTGGVISSLGKGLASAAIGAILKARGYKVRLRKCDPYLNIDPGTMSPDQHGEVFVTEDGAEADLDLGHYERLAGVTCRASDALTTGKVYAHVIARERRGDYLGATVQVIPHVTDAIKEFILAEIDNTVDFLICEVGGTVGDIEGLPFLESLRQLANEFGHEQTIFVHLTLVPYVASADEIKTKPSQHSVKELLHMGIQPDILLCRCDRKIPEAAKTKLAQFCNIKPEKVIEALDVDTIYQVPITYSEGNLDVEILKHFGLPADTKPDLSAWVQIVNRIHNPKKEVNIAVITKYTSLRDAYKSVIEAITHAGIHNNAKVNVNWVNSEALEKQSEEPRSPVSDEQIAKVLGDVSGILVTGGYGVRGTVGKMAAIRFARKRKIPFFGICLGMQLAVIETARNVAGIKEANSTEFGPTPDPIVGLLLEWQKGGVVERRSEFSGKGGTMRLGTYDCHLEPGSLAHKVYGQDVIQERHRHRYEVNINYREQLEKAGMKTTGLSTSGDLPTMVERTDHPWFLAMQFHPELKSNPFNPSPVFKAFIEAALKHSKAK